MILSFSCQKQTTLYDSVGRRLWPWWVYPLEEKDDLAQITSRSWATSTISQRQSRMRKSKADSPTMKSVSYLQKLLYTTGRCGGCCARRSGLHYRHPGTTMSGSPRASGRHYGWQGSGSRFCSILIFAIALEPRGHAHARTHTPAITILAMVRQELFSSSPWRQDKTRTLIEAACLCIVQKTVRRVSLCKPSDLCYRCEQSSCSTDHHSTQMTKGFRNLPSTCWLIYLIV